MKTDREVQEFIDGLREELLFKNATERLALSTVSFNQLVEIGINKTIIKNFGEDFE